MKWGVLQIFDSNKDGTKIRLGKLMNRVEMSSSLIQKNGQTTEYLDFIRSKITHSSAKQWQWLKLWPYTIVILWFWNGEQILGEDFTHLCNFPVTRVANVNSLGHIPHGRIFSHTDGAKGKTTIYYLSPVQCLHIIGRGRRSKDALFLSSIGWNWDWNVYQESKPRLWSI